MKTFVDESDFDKVDEAWNNVTDKTKKEAILEANRYLNALGWRGKEVKNDKPKQIFYKVASEILINENKI